MRNMIFLTAGLLILITLFYFPQPEESIDSGTIEPTSIDNNIENFEDSVVETQTKEEVDSEEITSESASLLDPIENEAVIRGVVQNFDGQPISDIHIELTAKDKIVWEKNVFKAKTNHRGEFQLESVPPDKEYQLEVLATRNYLGRVENILAFNGMPSLTLMLESIQLVTIEGMIVGEHEAPIPGFEILVQNIGIAYPGRRIASDDSGYFQLSQFPIGEIQLSTTGNDHFKVSGLVLQPDEYRNLIIFIDKGDYHLTGWISNELGTPLAQTRVALTSNISRDDYQSYSFRFGVTDSNGKFSFSNLSGQDHEIIVDGIGYTPQNFVHRFTSLSDEIQIQLRSE